MSLLKKVSKKASSSSNKGNKPITENEDVASNIKDFLEAKKKQNQAKTDIARAEPEVIAVAEKARDKHCARTGKYESSCKVRSSTGEVTVKFPNKYSKISPDDEPDLQEVFGKEDYEKYFQEKTVAIMTKKATEDDKFIQDMIDLIGESKFSKYFDVSTHIEPKKHYHEQRSMDRMLASKHQEAVNRGLINPTKPSLTA